MSHIMRQIVPSPFQVATITAVAASPMGLEHACVWDAACEACDGTVLVGAENRDRCGSVLDQVGAPKKRSHQQSNFVSGRCVVLYVADQTGALATCRVYPSGKVHLVGGRSVPAVQGIFDFIAQRVVRSPLTAVGVRMITGSFKLLPEDTHIDRFALCPAWQSQMDGMVLFNPDRHAAVRVKLTCGAVIMFYRTGVITLTGNLTSISRAEALRAGVTAFIRRNPQVTSGYFH